MGLKYAFIIIGVLCVWLYGAITIDYNNLLDIPRPMYALLLAIMIGGAHFLTIRHMRKSQGKAYRTPKNEITARDFIIVFVATLGGVALSIFLALVTSALINEDSKAELTAPFVTCERDSSRIATTAVNKTLETTDATITLHSLISNVPQESKNPQAYAYECQKATLADISVELKGDTENNTFNVRNLALMTKENSNGVDLDELNDSSDFFAYATSKNLEAFKASADAQRGWVSFPMSEKADSTAQALLYEAAGETETLNLR